MGGRTGVGYAVGRLCAATTRPICLFIANNQLTSDTTQGVALAFLASAVAIMGIAASPDRRFYPRYFARTVTPINGLTFYLYAGSLFILSIAGIAIVGAITLYSGATFALCATIVCYFISEKLADELLRLRLFERDFATWGRSSIGRMLLQLTGFGLVLLIGGRATEAWTVVAALTVGNLLIFVPQLPTGFRSNLLRLETRTFVHILQRAAKSLVGNWVLWVIALLSAGVAYLDRFVALVLDRSALPLFMLIVMCFSIMQMAVDFYYVSRHRRDFLERRISVVSAFTSREFALSAGLGLALSLVSSAVALWSSKGGSEFPLGYIAIIAILQMATAVAAIPREVLYWSHLLNWILRIELLFWLLFATAAAAGWLFHLPAMTILVFVALCAGVRLLLYILAGSKSHAPARATVEHSH